MEGDDILSTVENDGEGKRRESTSSFYQELKREKERKIREKLESLQSKLREADSKNDEGSEEKEQEAVQAAGAAVSVAAAATSTTTAAAAAASAAANDELSAIDEEELPESVPNFILQVNNLNWWLKASDVEQLCRPFGVIQKLLPVENKVSGKCMGVWLVEFANSGGDETKTGDAAARAAAAALHGACKSNDEVCSAKQHGLQALCIERNVLIDPKTNRYYSLTFLNQRITPIYWYESFAATGTAGLLSRCVRNLPPEFYANDSSSNRNSVSNSNSSSSSSTAMQRNEQRRDDRYAYDQRRHDDYRYDGRRDRDYYPKRHRW